MDEDEQNEVPEDDYMNNFGGAGLGEDGGFGGIDFSKLGQGAGADAGDDLGGDEGGSDDDMPDLEDEDAEETDVKGKGKETASKIEEI